MTAVQRQAKLSELNAKIAETRTQLADLHKKLDELAAEKKALLETEKT